MAQVNSRRGWGWRALGLALLGSLCTAAAAQPARVPARTPSSLGRPHRPL